MADRILTPEEVADLLRVKVDWVREMARLNKLPSFKAGRFRRFKESEVLAWIESQRG